MTTQNQNIMKILIAPDKFKGSLTSSQAATAIREGIVQGMAKGSLQGIAPGGILHSAANKSVSENGAFCAQNSAFGKSVQEIGGICAQNLGIEQSVSENGAFCAQNSAFGKSVQEIVGICAQNTVGECCNEDGAGNDGCDVGNLRVEFRTVEIADGGDGSLEVLQKRLPEAKEVEILVHDPLGRLVPSQILLYRMPRNTELVTQSGIGAGKVPNSCPDDANTLFRAENTPVSCPERGELSAFIEMAKVSGLEMLSKEERNPLNTSTYGMGEAIRAAIERGATEITLSIGGSATNDGGAGMLQALGYRFFDASGMEIPAPISGGLLGQVASIVAPENIIGSAEVPAARGVDSHLNSQVWRGELQGIKFKVICDVTNPLLGQQGATAVYGPQKGADADALRVLEAGLANYAAVAERFLHIPQGCKEYPGAGAAGGVGYAGLAFLRAELIPGWRFFARITSLEESVQWADLVITGEGSLDSQSLSGKVVSGVLNLAAQYDKEVMIFCGVSKLAPDELDAVAHALQKGASCYSIASLGYPLEVCMSRAAQLLQQLAEKAVAGRQISL